MLNYLTAELNRIMSKKSVWLYFIVCFIFYALITFVSNSRLTNDSVLGDAMTLFSLLPLFAGTMLFSIVYNDDLTARTLPQIVGFGLPRYTIIIVKTLILTIITAVVFMIGATLYNGLYFILGVNTLENAIKSLSLLISPFLQIIGYSMIASIVVYGTQRATMAVIAFLVFALNIVPQLLSMFLASSFVTGIIGNITPYLMTSVINSIGHNAIAGNTNPADIVGLTLYIVGFILLAVFIFNKKEMEF